MADVVGVVSWGQFPMGKNPYIRVVAGGRATRYARVRNQNEPGPDKGTAGVPVGLRESWTAGPDARHRGSLHRKRRSSEPMVSPGLGGTEARHSVAERRHLAQAITRYAASNAAQGSALIRWARFRLLMFIPMRPPQNKGGTLYAGASFRAICDVVVLHRLMVRMVRWCERINRGADGVHLSGGRLDCGNVLLRASGQMR